LVGPLRGDSRETGDARARPEDGQALLRVKGVGPKIVERYGAAILERVREAIETTGAP
jgi:hypothetical protein